MKPHERVYLHFRAQLLEDRRRAVAARGETFHPARSFVPLQDSVLHAQALIQPADSAQPARLVLRLLHDARDEVSEDALDHEAAAFFGGRPFTALPRILVDDGTIERAYYIETVENRAVSWV